MVRVLPLGVMTEFWGNVRSPKICDRPGNVPANRHRVRVDAIAFQSITDVAKMCCSLHHYLTGLQRIDVRFKASR